MNSPPLLNEHGVFVLDSAVVESLKQAAFQSPLRRVRIYLLAGLDSPVQEMIISLAELATMKWLGGLEMIAFILA